MKAVLLCRYKPNVDPFFSRMMRVLQANRRLKILSQTSIHVRDGGILMGCLDEYGILEYGQVFVQHSVVQSDKNKIIVAYLNMGYINYFHLFRPHPNECFGGDLDGDIYYVCWDSDIVPPKQMPPMDYIAATSMQLDRDITVEDVVTYFTDNVGQDNLYLAFADQNLEMANTKPCLRLAELFLIAVDSPKTV